MSAGALGGVNQIAASQQAQASNGNDRAQRNPYAQMESGEFVNMLVQQLTNQNPMKPQDSSQILKQLSSIRNIESQTQLQDKLESLVTQNEVSKASGMIGKVVTGIDASNEQIQGQVAAVRVTDEGATLELDTGKRLAMDRVTRISAANGS